MDGLDDLDQRGRELLAELTDDPDSDCWRRFDALHYELVWKYLRANHEKLAALVARYLKMDTVIAPHVLPEEVDEVAHEATTIALRRVRQNAARFDPTQGRPTMWVIGAAEFAWVDVAKTIVAARRSERLAFVALEDLLDVADPNPTTEEHVLRHLRDTEALEDASNHLNENEFAAVRLVVTAGYSYREAAQVIFGDATKTKQVDGLLTRGKAKLANAWQDRRPSRRSAGGANLADRSGDKEVTDG